MFKNIDAVSVGGKKNDLKFVMSLQDRMRTTIQRTILDSYEGVNGIWFFFRPVKEDGSEKVFAILIGNDDYMLKGRRHKVELWSNVSNLSTIDIFINWLIRKLDGESDASVNVFASASGAVEPEPESNIPGLSFQRMAIYKHPQYPMSTYIKAMSYAREIGADGAFLDVEKSLRWMEESSGDGDSDLLEVVKALHAVDIKFVLVQR